ncbi:MAG: glucose-1-phosphate thymidylyltransferase, partial [Bacteroides sp.]
YGATTIGPECKVGGELSNVSIQSYSNKAHDGFIGNAVIGSWCNLGADTNCSNLKNTYEQVKIWSEVEGHYISTGLQFCGLFMGDHSKTGINTMLNTGTSIGAFCNIFGSGFPRTWIPPFSWGGAAGFETQNIEQALRTARIVMARRGCELSKEAEDAAYKLYFEVLQNTKKQ